MDSFIEIGRFVIILDSSFVRNSANVPKNSKKRLKTVITFLKTPSVLNTKQRLEKSVNVPKTVKTFENSDNVFENTKCF